MRHALELAWRGRGFVEPNPMVGAVIVREGRWVGEGFHERFGGPHAEVRALDAARAAGADVRGATMLVTLEPCNHTGKTPPCTEAILRAGLGRVVAAMADPDPQVAGRGLNRLREAGVEVAVGVCEQATRDLLAGYVKLRTQHRPWVLAKWAQTSDGCLAVPGQRWISGPEARAEVHALRSWCDGIAVGVGTVLADDPLLTNRSGAGRQPIRLVVDSSLRTPPGCAMLESLDVSPVWIATTGEARRGNPDRFDALRRAGAELLALPADPTGKVALPALLDELGRRSWTTLLVEGGAELIRSLLEEHLVDELQVYISPAVGGKAPSLPRLGIEQVLTPGDWQERETRTVGQDVFRCYRVAGA